VTSEWDRDLAFSSIKNMVMVVREHLYSSGQLLAVHMFDDINLQMSSAKGTGIL
jgi:hypothetical protein